MTQPPLDDTQPVRPVRPSAGTVTPYEGPLLDPDGETFEDESRGVGCSMSVLLFGIIGAFALVIVGLSATAGWTSGQRFASVNATATSAADLQHQIELVSADIAASNYERADIRLRYLATQASGLSGLPELMQTGTALYLTRQPTSTPTPTETPIPTLTAAGPTSEPTAEATPTLSDPFDLGGRLQRAQSAVSLAQWNDAINDLDVILSIDPNYQTALVRSLMSRALNERALMLYRSGELAEAIFMTDRAEEFGDIGELSFERYVAQLYITAKSRVGTSDYIGAINALNEVRSVAPNYQDGEIRRLLFQNYVNYADALMFGSPCAAVQQYTNALQMSNDGLISNKRATAQNYCEFGTPTPEGFIPTADPAGSGGDGTAPIGQP